MSANHGFTLCYSGVPIIEVDGWSETSSGVDGTTPFLQVAACVMN